MGNPVYAAQVHITSIGLAPHLAAMLPVLRADRAVSTIHLWVNKSDGLQAVRDLERQSGVDCHLHYEPTNGIYDQWNAALDWTARYSEDRIAVVLNDDLIMPPDAINDIVTKMVRQPEFALVGLPYEGSQTQYDIAATRATWSGGGIGGFCWAAWPRRCARIDPRFDWWYGDDDLVQRTLFMGEKVGVARGTPVGHETSYTTQQRPELMDRVAEDRKLFDSLWG